MRVLLNIVFVNRLQFAVCLLFIFISACSKDPFGRCKDFEDFPQGYTHVAEADRRYFYTVPHYNPNNGNEITCLQLDNANRMLSIIIYNLQTTETKTVFSSDKIWAFPRWSVKNWLVFGQQGDAYKIKTDGDSLTRLTNTGLCHYPFWSPDGTKIKCQINDGSSSEIIDENGVLIKRLDNLPHKGGDWSASNRLIVSGHSSQIVLIDDSTYSSRTIEVVRNKAYFSTAWLDADNLLCVLGESIYKINIHTEQKILIKEGCQSKAYMSISVSPDKQKMIVQTQEYEVNKKNKTIENHKGIYVLNIDGSNEIEVPLPKN